MKLKKHLITATVTLSVMGMLSGCSTSDSSAPSKLNSSNPISAESNTHHSHTTISRKTKNISTRSSYIQAPNAVSPGSTIKISGQLPTIIKGTDKVTITLYRDGVLNSGLNFEAQVSDAGTFVASILIPKRIPDGQYQFLVFDYSAVRNQPVLESGVYISPMQNTQIPPQKVPVLNIWATPPLIGTMIKMDGWVPRGIDSVKLVIGESTNEIQRIFPVQSNGYFEQEMVLPNTLTFGKTNFTILSMSNKVIIKKEVIVAK